MDELIEHVSIHRQGGVDQLETGRLAVAPPAAGEVRVRQLAIGVNFLDVYHRNGTYPLPQLPATPGVEGAGVVEALGPGVTGFEPGQRVAYTGLLGAYAAVRNVPADRLVAVPDAVSLDAVAGGLLRGLTAHMLFAHVRELRAGDTVLVHAAAGGLGLVLTQWASALGARVIGTAGNRDKAALALAHGAERVVLYREEDFVAAAREFSGGRGVDFAIDGIGGATLLRTFDAVRPYGMAASVGQAGGSMEPVDLLQIGKPRHRVCATERDAVHDDSRPVPGRRAGDAGAAGGGPARAGRAGPAAGARGRGACGAGSGADERRGAAAAPIKKCLTNQ